MLHRICGSRQNIAHQGFQLHLAKSPARALIPKEFLEAHHVGGKTVDFFLGLVYGRQPFITLVKVSLVFLNPSSRRSVTCPLI